MSSVKVEELNKSQLIIASLKNLTLKRIELEKEMEAKTFELQMSYQTKFQELESSFKDIIGGKEVKMEECKKFLSMIPSSLNVEKYIGTPPPDADLSNGIKNYWLTVLQTFPRTSPMVNILDEPLLSHLTDVRVFHVSPENPSRDYPDIKNYGIVLELYFSENEYISNSKLYKCYHLGYSTDEKMLLDNSGLMPIHIDVSKIEWLPDMNLTVKTVKKTQKNKKTKQIRVVSKTEKADTFFNFFSNIDDLEIKNIENEEERKMILESLLISDYDLTCEIETEMIPKSILYFMDEISHMDTDSDDSEEDDDYLELDEAASDASHEYSKDRSCREKRCCKK